jgi:hypothetical protein
VITDNVGPGLNGMRLIETLLQEAPQPVAIVDWTGLPSEEKKKRFYAMSGEIALLVDYCVRPTDRTVFAHAIEHALQRLTGK